MDIWIAVAATTVLVGSVWQTALEMGRQIRGMSFLRAHNAIVREELQRIRREVPVWRRLRRRSERRAMTRAVFQTLSPEEAALSRDYDRSAWGWSFITMGTLVATIAAWVQWAAGI